jgi:hypothetical protein
MNAGGLSRRMRLRQRLLWLWRKTALWLLLFMAPKFTTISPTINEIYYGHDDVEYYRDELSGKMRS